MIDTPVFLLGMPRSGTTWLSQLVEAHPRFRVRLSPIYSYELKDALDVDSTPEEWIDVLSAAARSDDPFMTQDWQRQRGNLPARRPRGDDRLAVKDTRFHDIYIAGMQRLPRARTVVIVRNPLAMLHSWWRSPEFPPDGDFDREWRTGSIRKGEGPGEYWGFDDWTTLTRRYRNLAASAPDRWLIIRFEDLVADTAGVMGAVLDHVGEALDPDVLAFADRSHAHHAPDPYSVYKDPSIVIDAWRSGLDGNVIEAVREELAGTELEVYLR